jgi:putative SOS response-associated peptidase YedK
MCGRIALFTPPIRLARLLDAALAAGIEPEGRPSWNVGPQRRLFGVALEEGARVLDRYRWGLLPSWSKDPLIANRLFNARAETVAEKPSFRSAYARRTCAIPVDGFYEWDHRPGKDRQPHYFSRADGAPMVLAGLYEFWRDPAAPEGTEALRTCTVITTEPSADMDGLHDRMPVVLELPDVGEWLDVAAHDGSERHGLLRPAPRGTLTHFGVDKAVGSVRNDGPELIEPSEPGALF